MSLTNTDDTDLPAKSNLDETLECPNECRMLASIGNKWTVMVVGALADGPVRFNGLRRRISGISQRMLTLTLRGLERDGLVKRTVYPTIPPRVEYELTDLSRTLTEPLNALSAWAQSNQHKMERARKAYDARAEDETF